MKEKQISNAVADLGLVSVTLFWGTTFILSKILLGELSLINYLAIRLTLAALLMFLIAWRYRSQFNYRTVRAGFILGVFLFISYFFQMWGIKFTSATNAGFITALNVVFIPIFSIILFKDRPKKSSLFGILLATIGLYFLSGGDFSALNKGDWLVFICAIAVTFHVILTGKFAPNHNIYLLTAVQLGTIALFSIILMVINNEPIITLNWRIFGILVYLAFFGTVYTFLMQTAMQRFTTATRTALVFTLEPVFAALFAYLIAAEKMLPLGWLGGIFILCGMFVAEIQWDKVFKK
jgi:drug/metabolite transporter (DMT)-like permease